MIVSQLWRYPVASIGGYETGRLDFNEAGVFGDRSSFLIDLTTGETAAPEKSARWRPALQLAAASRDGSVFVTGSRWTFALDDERLDDALSEHFGFRCGMRSSGASVVAYDGAIEVRSRYEVAPLHIVFAEEMDALQAALPNTTIDARRFRPNVVIEGGTLENVSVGSRFAIGDRSMTITEKTKRCGMTMIAQDGLTEDAEILRTIVRQRSRCFGVYAAVSGDGAIAAGAELTPS
jgi:uncharacterized protein YcbX